MGEIVVERPSRFSGYLGRGRRPAPADAPLRTGDLGRLDRPGPPRRRRPPRRPHRPRRRERRARPRWRRCSRRTPTIAEACVVGRPGRDRGARSRSRRRAARGRRCRSGRRGARPPTPAPRSPGSRSRRVRPRSTRCRARRAASSAATRASAPGGRAGGRARAARRRRDRLAGDGLGGRGPVAPASTARSRPPPSWTASPPPLAQPGDVTVHALDRRGSGSSRLVPPRPLDVAVHVDDLVAYLDARGIDRAVLVGRQLRRRARPRARRPATRTASLAVVAYEPPYGPLADEASAGRVRRASPSTAAAAHRTGGAAAAAETFLRAVAGDGAWERLPERARDVPRARGRRRPRRRRPGGPRSRRPRAGSPRPSRILTGGASEPFYAPIADALAGRIPGARRRTLDGPHAPLAHHAAGQRRRRRPSLPGAHPHDRRPPARPHARPAPRPAPGNAAAPPEVRVMFDRIAPRYDLDEPAHLARSRSRAGGGGWWPAPGSGRAVARSTSRAAPARWRPTSTRGSSRAGGCWASTCRPG